MMRSGAWVRAVAWITLQGHAQKRNPTARRIYHSALRSTADDIFAPMSGDDCAIALPSCLVPWPQLKDADYAPLGAAGFTSTQPQTCSCASKLRRAFPSSLPSTLAPNTARSGCSVLSVPPRSWSLSNSCSLQDATRGREAVLVSPEPMAALRNPRA